MTEVITSTQEIASELIPNKPKLIQYSLMVKTSSSKHQHSMYVKIGNVVANKVTMKIVKVTLLDHSHNIDGYIKLIMNDLNDNYGISDLSYKSSRCLIL